MRPMQSLVNFSHTGRPATLRAGSERCVIGAGASLQSQCRDVTPRPSSGRMLRAARYRRNLVGAQLD
jgi:hypothetical protein